MNRIQTAAIAFLLAFSGCAQTTIYENGGRVAVIQGDATNVSLKTYRGSEFHADTLNHSESTKAVGNTFMQIVGSLAGLAAGIAKFFF